MRVGIVGAGIFGLAAALELNRRGHQVTLFERGPIPCPDASSTGGRACLYTNTPDDHFVIDWAPGARGILIAGCGSGHGFKFGGSIGPVIADALEDRENPLGDLFRLGQRFGGSADGT